MPASRSTLLVRVTRDGMADRPNPGHVAPPMTVTQTGRAGPAPPEGCSPLPGRYTEPGLGLVRPAGALSNESNPSPHVPGTGPTRPGTTRVGCQWLTRRRGPDPRASRLRRNRRLAPRTPRASANPGHDRTGPGPSARRDSAARTALRRMSTHRPAACPRWARPR